MAKIFLFPFYFIWPCLQALWQLWRLICVFIWDKLIWPKQRNSTSSSGQQTAKAIIVTPYIFILCAIYTSVIDTMRNAPSAISALDLIIITAMLSLPLWFVHFAKYLFKRAAAYASKRKETKNYVVLDIETTGLRKNTDRIIEIAAIRYSNGREIEEYHTMVDPERPLSSKIIELTGITQADLTGAPTIDEIRDDFLSFIGSSTLVGHNAKQFDIPFLAAQLHAQIDNKVIDTLCLAREHFPDLPNHRLEYLKEQLGLYSGGSHRALDDVKTTNALFLRCVE